MVEANQEVELAIEKPAAGGRMIARHDGLVVLVSGGIPGERVRARIDLPGRRLAYATVVEVLEPHPDRRPVTGDWTCGGACYAHIAYPRQLRLKSEIIADAFARIARLPLGMPVAVTGSPEREYRMRARLHVHEVLVGFFREGTHELCDAGRTGQLSAGAARMLGGIPPALRRVRGKGVLALDLMEDMSGEERALHVELEGHSPVRPRDLVPLARLPGVAGVTCSRSPRAQGLLVGGRPYVSDPVARVLPGRSLTVPDATIRRHARAFFQGNRFVLPALVSRVADLAAGGPVCDLYAGVGLFAVALAAGGRRGVTAVDVDRVACSDLEVNAAPFGDAIRVERSTVEGYLERAAPDPGRIAIVDPPRMGLSEQAVSRLLARAPRRVVYVSCDVATFARDARLLVDGGYALTSVDGFDLFPTTAHLETVGVFERR